MTNKVKNEIRNVESKFTYYELFSIRKKLNNEISKLKDVISIYKKTISSLKNENEKLIEEIDHLIKTS